MDIKKDDVPTDDKVEVEVRVEDDTKEPVNTETPSGGEDTPTNEPSKPESQDEKRSAGQVIANLGNEKKQIAEKLVTLAKTNETARKEVKAMLLSDPSTANYLKTKFGDDYDLIVGEEPVSSSDAVDIEKIRAEEQAKAEAKAIKASIQSNHDQMLTEKAKDLGFNSEEFELFKQKVSLLGGDEQAMQDAALIVNRTKATANVGTPVPDGGEADRPKKKVLTITPGLNQFAQDRALDQGEFASNLARVKALHREDKYGKPVMELPGL